MTRKEFMYRLAEQLLPLPPEERVSALKYYDEYFDDAGPENESRIVEELGDPRTVAESIIREYAQNNPGWRPGGAAQSSGAVGQPAAAPGQPAVSKSRTWIWVLVAVLTCWLWVPVLVAALATVMGLLVAAVACVAGLAVAAGAVAVGGILIFVCSMGAVAAAPGVGVLGLGTGLLLTGAGALALVLLLWLMVKAVPAVFRWIIGICRMPFHRRKGGEQA